MMEPDALLVAVQNRDLGELTHLGFETAFVVGEIGDAQLGAGGLELLSDAPGDRAVVGNAGDEDLLAGEIEKHRAVPAG